MRGVRGIGLTVAVVALIVASGCSGSAQGGGLAGDDGSPEAALVARKCSMCHTLERINQAQYDRAKWTATVERMQGNGLVVTADEAAQIIDFLSSR